MLSAGMHNFALKLCPLRSRVWRLVLNVRVVSTGSALGLCNSGVESSPAPVVCEQRSFM